MSDKQPDNTPQQRAREAFIALISGEDTAIDLALAALLIAQEEYADLNISHYLSQLDLLAQRVRDILCLPTTDTPTDLPDHVQPLDAIAALNQVLFTQEHFRGNQNDYYDPRNSFLNDVLERHTGIPISLSLIYIEVGKRLGLQIEGIGLPFHFVVRYHVPDGDIYIDPFEQGRLLIEQQCRERVLQMLKGRVKFNPRWLEPVSNRQFLVRMLGNLKNIYLYISDYPRALPICERILLLTPKAPLELRDRGIVHLQLKHYSRALRDFTSYLELAPDAENKDKIRQQIKALRQMIAMLN
jgi:regulator of sirC expression with transglutaminase-like and TPR domain